MIPVIQEELTGCGIACAAAIVGISYQEAKKAANAMGIHYQDPMLWSDTLYVRQLLSQLGVHLAKEETPFNGWDALPECALLSIKWRLVLNRPLWHWVVFYREGEKQFVLDSKKGLKHNLRTDFGRMKPKWYIPVYA